jgi:hypothetical protein
MGGPFKKVIDTLRQTNPASDLIDLANIETCFITDALRAASNNADYARNFFFELAYVPGTPSAVLPYLIAPLSEQSVWGHISEATCSNLAATYIHPSVVHAERIIPNDAMPRLPIDNGLRLWQFLLASSQTPETPGTRIIPAQRALIIKTFSDVGLHLGKGGDPAAL